MYSVLREDWCPFSQKSLLLSEDSGCGESHDEHVTGGKGSLDTHGDLAWRGFWSDNVPAEAPE